MQTHVQPNWFNFLFISEHAFLYLILSSLPFTIFSFLSTFCYIQCNFHNNIDNVLSVTVLIYYGRSQLKLRFPGFRLLPYLNYLLYTLCWNNCYIYHVYIHCVLYCAFEKEINVNKYKKYSSLEFLVLMSWCMVRSSKETPVWIPHPILLGLHGLLSWLGAPRNRNIRWEAIDRRPRSKIPQNTGLDVYRCCWFFWHFPSSSNDFR